jgi:hypothetical protein
VGLDRCDLQDRPLAAVQAPDEEAVDPTFARL